LAREGNKKLISGPRPKKVVHHCPNGLDECLDPTVLLFEIQQDQAQLNTFMSQCIDSIIIYSIFGFFNILGLQYFLSIINSSLFAL